MNNKGSCLCGKITITVDKFLPLIGHCHCVMCRKFHGAAFSTFGEVKREHFHLTSGEIFLKNFKAENGTVRSFCQLCGSSLLFESRYNRQDNTVEVALACFDEIEHLTPNAHIYTESKADWFEINDKLRHFKQYRES